MNVGDKQNYVQFPLLFKLEESLSEVILYLWHI